jgi:hypothetical protein
MYKQTTFEALSEQRQLKMNKQAEEKPVEKKQTEEKQVAEKQEVPRFFV